MPPLTKAHGEDFATTTGYNGEEDTTHAQGEEDPLTTAAAGEEDETFLAPVENAFGSF